MSTSNKQKKSEENYPIDMVYLWCDIHDEAFKKKKENFLKNIKVENESNNICRFISNDELKYSLRSLEKYAFWINKIYIVTDNQIPSWLNTDNPKIKVINQESILPKDAIPCFNSSAIEHCIINIEDLSEHFLYANDDMFFCDYVSPDFFFKDGEPLNRYNKPYCVKDKSLYIQQLNNSRKLIKEKFNRDIRLSSHHNIDAYRKSYIKECQDDFYSEINKTIHSHLRDASDIQRIIYSSYSAVKHKCKIIQTDKFKLFDKKRDSVVFFPKSRKKEVKLKTYSPKLFCINDTETTTDKDRESMKEFLEKIFPEKSTFERCIK